MPSDAPREEVPLRRSSRTRRKLFADEDEKPIPVVYTRPGGARAKNQAGGTSKLQSALFAVQSASTRSLSGQTATSRGEAGGAAKPVAHIGPTQRRGHTLVAAARSKGGNAHADAEPASKVCPR